MQHLEYVPFGEVFIEERNNTWNTSYKFNAKELDEETGLYYYGARYYDPRTGVWLSVDPLAESRIGWSPYAYCLNNPILRIDPNGLTDFTFDKKTGDVKQVGEKNDDPDRILKTNRKGEVKYKKNGEPKVAVGGIEHGILKDGQNFKNKDEVISVGGEDQPSVEGVKFSFNNILQEFHTHPNGELGATQSAREQSQDVNALQNDKSMIPNASFIILYRITGQEQPAEYDYTHEYRP